MQEALQINNFWKHSRFWRHASLWVIFIGGHLAWTLSSEDFESNDLARLAFDQLSFLFFIYASFTAYNIIVKGGGRWFLFFLLQVFLIALMIFHFEYIKPILFPDWSYDQPKKLEVIRNFNCDFSATSLGLVMASFFPYFLLLFAFFMKIVIYGGVRAGNNLLELNNSQSDIQLSTLKNQINPHFLFNILNAIYSVNLTDRNKGNKLLLKLSDLMRYQLESSEKKHIPLIHEIESIENYVNLEKIRVHNCDVTIGKNGDFEQYEIAPLIFNPIVENAFKYGTGVNSGVISIEFDLDGVWFHFKCINDKIRSSTKLSSTGIGLNNVTRRLNLLYPDSHIYEVCEDDWKYEVSISISLALLRRSKRRFQSKIDQS